LEPVTVYLGLGSNLGQREANLARAISAIGGQGQPFDSAQGERVELLRVSSIYETAPWGYTEQPPFLNCVVEAETTLPPPLLLQAVQELENAMGRKPGIRYGPRLIDVDILLYGSLTIDQPDLQIPHPRIPERAFVLIPLAELAPVLVHPTLQLPIAELARRVQGRGGVTRWGPPPTILDSLKH
jgi:2-amino-4-hydroxy-6-hydroxymethyldihydropteridine diphosphokinase